MKYEEAAVLASRTIADTNKSDAGLLSIGAGILALAAAVARLADKLAEKQTKTE